MFTSIDVSWPGSIHDERIWKSIRQILSRIENIVLLADDAYGIEPNPDDDAPTSFNKLLKKEKITIEPCFGQLLNGDSPSCSIFSVSSFLGDRNFEEHEDDSEVAADAIAKCGDEVGNMQVR